MSWCQPSHTSALSYIYRPISIHSPPDRLLCFCLSVPLTFSAFLHPACLLDSSSLTWSPFVQVLHLPCLSGLDFYLFFLLQVNVLFHLSGLSVMPGHAMRVDCCYRELLNMQTRAGLNWSNYWIKRFMRCTIRKKKRVKRHYTKAAPRRVRSWQVLGVCLNTNTLFGKAQIVGFIQIFVSYKYFKNYLFLGRNMNV